MKCPFCNKNMHKAKSRFGKDKVDFEMYVCDYCKEELMDMKQLNTLSKEYRKLGKSREVKFTKWGNSLAVRVSKKFIDELKIKPGQTARMYKQGKELRIIVS